jgi:hypothetical protein
MARLGQARRSGARQGVAGHGKVFLEERYMKILRCDGCGAVFEDEFTRKGFYVRDMDAAPCSPRNPKDKRTELTNLDLCFNCGNRFKELVRRFLAEVG